MTSGSALLAGRRAAHAQMVDSCTVTRGGGVPTFNPATASYTTSAGTVVYTGRCKVQVQPMAVLEAEAGGAEVSTQRLTVHVPVSVTGLEIGDVATITAAAFDPDLVGRSFRLTGTHAKSTATARRCPAEEVTTR